MRFREKQLSLQAKTGDPVGDPGKRCLLHSRLSEKGGGEGLEALEGVGETGVESGPIRFRKTQTLTQSW